MWLNLPVIFIRRFVQYWRFHLLYFYVKLPLGFRSTDQNQSDRLVEEVSINQFLGWYRCGDDSQYNWWILVENSCTLSRSLSQLMRGRCTWNSLFYKSIFFWWLTYFSMFFSICAWEFILHSDIGFFIKGSSCDVFSFLRRIVFFGLRPHFVTLNLKLQFYLIQKVKKSLQSLLSS